MQYKTILELKEYPQLAMNCMDLFLWSRHTKSAESLVDD